MTEISYMGKSTCACPQLLNHVWLFVTPTDCSLPGSSFHGILQVRTPEQVAISWASQVVLVLRNPPANAGDIRDAGSIPGLGGSLGRGHGNPLQYSCLENPMDRGAWWVTVHRVAKSWTLLKWLSTQACHFLLHLTGPGTEPTSLCLLHWQVVSLPLCQLGSLGKSTLSSKPLLTQFWPEDTWRSPWYVWLTAPVWMHGWPYRENSMQ